MTTDWQELTQRYLAGLATDAEAAALAQALKEDAELRALYLDYANLDVALEAAAEMADELHESWDDAAMRPRRSGWRFWRSFAAAAAAVIVTAVLWMSAQAPGNTPTIATVLLAEDCTWQEGTGVAEGERLAPCTLSLLSGLAIVRFDGGAEVVLRGETEVELLSAAEARLVHGAVTVRAPEEAAGFKLRTPASELTDLGTEFAVKVERSGATELHVLEGEVAYAPDAKTSGAVLNAGQALRFDEARGAPRPVALDASRFAELVKQAAPRERADLLTVYEGFRYDEGTYAPSEIALLGKGWKAPWRLREGVELYGIHREESTQDMRIVHGRLNVPWPVPGGRQGALEMPAGKSYRVRQMQQPIAMNGDGITYFSLMTREPKHAPPGSDGGPAEGMRLIFRASADYWGECLMFGWNRQLLPRIQTGPGPTFTSPAAIPDEETLLWVGKIIRRAEGEDEVSLRIYGEQDPLDYAEPATWHVSSRELQLSAALDLVVLTSIGASPRIVDELRIGPTWRSVVPFESASISTP
jgi:FecR protein